MDYNRVALFVRVVHAGSFTAAAAAAGLPKSSVSRGIAQLEQELGVRLLQRTTRKLALTAVGQAYYDAVAGSVAAIEEADARAREHSDEPRGQVRLTAPPDVAGLAPALTRFKRKYPGIRLELTVTPRYLDLVAEGIDLALRAGRLEDSSLVVRRMGATEQSLVAAPAYLDARGRPATLDDLAGHDFVLYRAHNGRGALQLTGPDGERTVEVAAAMVVDDLSFCRRAAEEGAGIALLPIYNAVASLAPGRLELVLPEWTSPGASLYIVLPSSRHVPARVALLRDFLVAEIGSELAALNEKCDQKRRSRGRREVLVQTAAAR